MSSDVWVKRSTGADTCDHLQGSLDPAVVEPRAEERVGFFCEDLGPAKPPVADDPPARGGEAPQSVQRSAYEQGEDGDPDASASRTSSVSARKAGMSFGLRVQFSA